jgi:pilus assembly protein CpaE
MEEQTHIVIIDLDESSCKVMQAILQEIPEIEVKSETTDFTKGLDLIKQVKPSIVILNLFPAEEPVFNLAQRITRYFPDISLFITSKQTDSILVIRAMRAGACEFICQPVVKDELVSAVVTVVKAKKQSLQEKGKEGKVMTFFGVGGGVGTSTIVTNAATTLAKLTQKEVIVIDLNLHFGSAALMLNLRTKYSILDVAKNIENIDIAILKQMLPKNSSGVSLLSAPHMIEDAESISASQIEHVLVFLRKIYDYILIDTNHVFDDVTLKALDECDQIFTISYFDVPTIYNTKRCLDLFQKIGYNKEKVLLVINRYSTEDDIDAPAMEKLIDYPIFWRIPEHDPKSVLNSINKGIPMAQMMPNSKLSLNFVDMIRNLNGEILPEDIETETTKKIPFIKKILKQQD